MGRRVRSLCGRRKITWFEVFAGRGKAIRQLAAGPRVERFSALVGIKGADDSGWRLGSAAQRARPMLDLFVCLRPVNIQGRPHR